MTPQVYRRDASWHADGRGGGNAFAYHWPNDDDAVGLTACGASVCNETTAADPATVKASSRCQRSGCKQRWRKWAAKAVTS